MREAILYGVGIGLTLSLLLGPVFFALIQTSIQKGFLSGLALTVGISLSDATVISLLYLFLSRITSIVWFDEALSIFGGGFLVWFGINTAMKSKAKIRAMRIYEPFSGNNFKQLAKGYTLNSLHPGVWIYWLGIVSIVKSQETPSSGFPKTIFIAALSTLFCTDLIKSYLASRLKKRITIDVIYRINHVIGVIIVIMGLALVGKLIWDHI